MAGGEPKGSSLFARPETGGAASPRKREMADNVARVPGVTFITPDALGQGAETNQRPVRSENDAGRYRLTIEEGPNGFVYKTRDRVTGEVIRQLPREDVVKMRHSPAYGPGELIKTRA